MQPGRHPASADDGEVLQLLSSKTATYGWRTIGWDLRLSIVVKNEEGALGMVGGRV